MELLKSIVCLNCGGEVEISADGREATCKYCRRTYKIGSTLKDSALIAFSQATEYWKTDRFADAKRKFSEVTKENPEFSEAWWGAFVSEYGIQFEYSRFGDMVPTCHRAHTVAVSKDKNYKKAVETADEENKKEYVSLGNEIERIRAEIIRKSEDGESYDVFICFKATEINAPGKKTDDYYLGQDIYHELKREGYNVFFSAETLARIGEQDFEPYIFKALSTAKVMLVLCSDNEKIESAWVKNEWGRFLDMRGGKGLIPVCGNNGTKYTPYELPEELRKFNAIEYDGKLFEKLKTKIEAYFPERVKARKEAERKAREAEYEAKFAKEREEQAELLKKQQAEIEAKRLAQEEEWRKQQEKSEAERRAQEERTKQLQEQLEALMKQVSASEAASKEKAREVPKNAPASDEKAEKEQSQKLREQLEADRQAQAELFKKQQEQLEALMKKMSEQSEKKTDSPAPVKHKTAASDFGNGSGASSMLKRAFAFLSAGEFQSADECCEKALDIDPMTAEAYLGKLMAELQVKTREDLKKCNIPFDGRGNYKKALKYAGAELKNELENIRLESAYNRAKGEMQAASTEAEYKAAAKSFTAIKGYKDSEKLSFECLEKAENARIEALYSAATKAMQSAKSESDYEAAAKSFEAVKSYKDSGKLAEQCRENAAYCLKKAENARLENLYNKAKDEFRSAFGEERCRAAAKSFKALGNYRDSKTLAAEYLKKAENIRLENLYNKAKSEMQSAMGDEELKAAAKSFKALGNYLNSEKLAAECIEKAAHAGTVFGEKDLVIKNGVLESVSRRVKDCKGKYSVVIPSGVKSIGEQAFRCCTGLTSVSIPNSVTSIDAYAFGDCWGLTSIPMGNGVTDIGYNAFYNCSGLTEVTLPDNVTTVRGSAFSNCYNIKSVTIGKGVKSLGINAFEGCTGLTEIKFNAMHCGGCINAFENDGVFENAGTSERGITVSFDKSVYQIPSALFKGCTMIKGITIPSSITMIEDGAFENCTGLTGISIPDSVTYVGSYAFSGCTGLASVTIGKGVKTIEKETFKGCTGLVSVDIPIGVTSIKYDAFRDCSGLKAISYAGTKKQWHAVSKDDSWDISTGKYKVNFS